MYQISYSAANCQHPKGTLTDSSLPILAAEINSEHRACGESVRRSLCHARLAGELLARAKEILPHGDWGQWLSEQFEGSQRTAQAYMRISEQWEAIEAKAQHVAHLTYREALKLISERRPQQKSGTNTSASNASGFAPDIDSDYERWEASRANTTDISANNGCEEPPPDEERMPEGYEHLSFFADDEDEPPESYEPFEPQPSNGHARQPICGNRHLRNSADSRPMSRAAENRIAAAKSWDAQQDDAGNTVPAELVEVFQSRAEFHSLRGIFDGAIARVEKLANGPAGREIPRAMVSHLRSAVDDIWAARPSRYDGTKGEWYSAGQLRDTF